MSDILTLESDFITKPQTSGILFPTSPIFILRKLVVTKLFRSDILFSTCPIFALTTVVVDKPLTSGIFFHKKYPIFSSKFFLSVFYWFFSIKVAVSEIYFSKLFTFVFRLLNFVFLTPSLLTISLISFISVGTVFNIPTSKSAVLFLKLFKAVGTLTIYWNLICQL